MRLGKLAFVLVPLFLAAALLRVDSPGRSEPPATPPTVAEADHMLRGQPACFVPNLGQWAHQAAYVARFGAMTVFFEENGWTFTLVERTGEVKNAPEPEMRGVREREPPGHRD